MGVSKKSSRESGLSCREYTTFDQLDGHHPLQKAVPDSVVLYKVRTRKGGKVSFLNYELAREIGLLSKNHPDVMNKKLEEKILYTFGIVIINEYDGIHNITYPEEDIRKNKYMATRYLQIQHPNKKGKTSGDGRSIWNGIVSHQGKIWDVSSRGTGATILSPASSINEKFYQTGDPNVSYGCGYSELDEGLSTALFSEIMKKNHIATERVLLVIDYGGGICITVRAHENLIRPSHLFSYLKQNSYDNLKKMMDYYINRQIQNRTWLNVPKRADLKYSYFLEKVIHAFANVAASFEDEYIFCWFDWDGDNILMDGGIIDYGSIRQFGLFHSEYRYDDVERYSTTIVEQKAKVKYIVQTFVQIIDYLLTKKKKNIKCYAQSSHLFQFEKIFQEKKDFNLAYKIGLSQKDARYIAEQHTELVREFRKVFSYFERSKSVEGLYEVPDGINCNAVFCMRDILRELPTKYLDDDKDISVEEFIKIIKSTYAKKEDLTLTNYRKSKVKQFQKLYKEIVKKVVKKTKSNYQKKILEIAMRSSIINKYDRVTGDSITLVTDKIMNYRPKFTPDQIYGIIAYFLKYQNFDPDNITEEKQKGAKHGPSKLLKSMVSIVKYFREGL